MPPAPQTYSRLRFVDGSQLEVQEKCPELGDLLTWSALPGKTITVTKADGAKVWINPALLVWIEPK